MGKAKLGYKTRSVTLQCVFHPPWLPANASPHLTQPWPGVPPVPEPPGPNIGSAGGGDATVERSKTFTSRGERAVFLVGRLDPGLLRCLLSPSPWVLEAQWVAAGQTRSRACPVSSLHADHHPTQSVLRTQQEEGGRGASSPGPSHALDPAEDRGPADLRSCSVGFAPDVVTLARCSQCGGQNTGLQEPNISWLSSRETTLDKYVYLPLSTVLNIPGY